MLIPVVSVSELNQPIHMKLSVLFPAWNNKYFKLPPIQCIYSSCISLLSSIPPKLFSRSFLFIPRRSASYHPLRNRSLQSPIFSVAQWLRCWACVQQVTARRGFNSQPWRYRATTLGKLFTPMCLCLPSSIIWYLVRAFMLMRR